MPNLIWLLAVPPALWAGLTLISFARRAAQSADQRRAIARRARLERARIERSEFRAHLREVRRG
jgi:hypothetical protein